MADRSHQAFLDTLKSQARLRENELIELHRSLVRIPSINWGKGRAQGEADVARCAQDYLTQAPIESDLVESAPGRANLLARWGSKGGPACLLMSHSDVVPPGDEAAWTHPPFSGALSDGRIWGRGANDCKMLTAAQLFAMRLIAESGTEPEGQIKLAIGADEEAGGAMGFGWLARERPDFLRADMAICEGGGSCLGQFEIGNDTRPVLSVGCGEKGCYQITLRIAGSGGHASTPWGRRNPLTTLGRLLERIDQFSLPVTPASPVFNALFDWLGETDVTEDNVNSLIDHYRLENPSLWRSLRAQSRMTLTPTIVRGGEKSNSLPDEVNLVCDARLLPGQALSELENYLKSLRTDFPDVTYEMSETAEPSLSPVDDALLERFKQAAGWALESEVEAAPTWCTGYTDARYVRALGTPVYGFQMIHPDADPERLGIHCLDESIETRMLLPCALSLIHLAVQLTH